MQYNLVLLGDSYRKNTPSLQYTSLLPSSGPTRISYLESQRRASRDGSVTPLRRSSRSTTPSRRFSLSAIHDHYPSGTEQFSRRRSMDSAPYTFSRGLSPTETAAELKNVNNYSTITPYTYDEDPEPITLARSGTVDKLLDKYSHFSLSDEYGYPKSTGRYNRYGAPNSYAQNDEDSLNDVGYSASSLKDRTTSITPERSEEPTSRYSQDRLKKFSLDDLSSRGKRTFQRPFSDIYETDELESPASDNDGLLRSSLIETAKKNYEALDSKYKLLPLQSGGTRLSYSDRLKDWKNKQDKLNENEVEERAPRKISHNRYESVLTGEDDYLPNETSYKKKKLYKSKTYNDDNDDDDDDDNDSEDNFSRQKFRNSLRQKYNQDLDELNKNLTSSYKTPSPSRFTRYGKSDLNYAKELEKPTPRKSKQCTGSMSDSVGPGRYGNLEEEIDAGSRRRGSLNIQNDPYDVGGYRSPYSYGGGYNAAHEQRMGYGQPPGYGAPPMYGYQPGPYRSYGAPAYGGGGMDMYSSRSPYVNPSPLRYGAGYAAPLNRYGPATSAYSSSRYEDGPSIGYKSIPYGGTYGGLGRRFTADLNLPNTDDDDDSDSYDPKRGQRQLASKIARKYIGDSDDDKD